MDFAQRLNLLHALCLAETYNDGLPDRIDLKSLTTQDSAHYLASYITFVAIREANRQPSEEVTDQFDHLSVYQAYALLVFAYLSLPVMRESQFSATQQSENNDSINKAPDLNAAQVTIAKTLFEGLSDAQLIELMQSGYNKFQLIGDAEAEHWADFRENLDKLTISFIIAGTDDDSPHEKEEIFPLFGQLLSQLCEAFERDLS